MTIVSIVVAVARNGAIGKGNALPWKLPRDLQHFKQATLGAPIIMGRKTWDSIGRPLPGRRNIVVTRQPDWAAEGAERAASLASALALVEQAPKVSVIGGAQIYAEALPLADELIVTEVDADFDADAFLPRWDRSAFALVERGEPIDENGVRYRFVKYRRIAENSADWIPPR
jgi:dihydrofolate reductase